MEGSEQEQERMLKGVKASRKVKEHEDRVHYLEFDNEEIVSDLHEHSFSGTPDAESRFRLHGLKRGSGGEEVKTAGVGSTLQSLEVNGRRGKS